MKYNLSKRVLSLILTLCMVLAFLPGTVAQASETPANYSRVNADAIQPVMSEQVPEEEAAETPQYAENDQVRVFIVLNEKPAIEKGYSTTDLAVNQKAMNYAAGLEKTQKAVAERISEEALQGESLNIRWNLTLVANAMSATVRFGDIPAIEKVSGVKAVHIAPIYELDQTIEAAEPNTSTAGGMVGSFDAWLDGYTGAGSRIAIVDTGIDPDHPSFDGTAFEYGLMVSSAKNGKEISDYHLLGEEEIAAILPKLHASTAMEGLTAKQLHVSSKIAFGFNYIDENLNISHDIDSQGDHGSHVSGIAAANRYVQVSGDDGMQFAYPDNGVVGIAPDAQIITMKVFGVGGGAYPDDYMAAIEDAILLNCDSVNLSLGSPMIGFAYDSEAYINEIMENLSKTETVVTMSCGNSGYWTEYSNSPTGLNYTDDANTNRVGSPGSYANSIAVASADNTGAIGSYIQIQGTNFVYNDKAPVAFDTLDTSEDQSGTEYPYIFLGSPMNPDDTVKYAGSLDDFKGLDLEGKIVLVSRGGGIDFTVKQKNAMDAGATGLIVYNNQPGSLNMALSYKLPTVSIQQAQVKTILELSEKDVQGRYAGTLQVMHGYATDVNAGGDTIVMSEFSSWGVPGNLTLKPEITAPGGNIYSTLNNGTYGHMSGTSMAAPSVTGMAAVVGQYVRENGLAEQEGITARALVHSLLMGTAVPSMDYNSEVEFSPRSQGSGLANVAGAVTSPTYITIDGNNDGKVKAELWDDPDRTGQYSFTFHVNNLSDKPASYQLEASILAPGILEQDGNSFMQLSDVALEADVRFTGETPYDLNGDGKIDENDVLAILQHITGTAPLSEDGISAADLNGSGTVEAVDAQILGDLLNGTSYGELTLKDLLDRSAITVPAHSTVTITTTITLTEEDRAYLARFANGTYVEGYVYLRAQADQEGVLTVDQSIPFLAFYGSWTESSMLDRFKYAEDYFDRDAHTPYLPFSIENYYTKRFKDVSTAYYFGLNLYASDNAYLGERNALSSSAGDYIYNLTYQLVRNAADVSFSITDADTGAVYYRTDYGNQYGAFYYTNGGAWMYTRTSKTINWAGTDAEGNPLPNNTKVNMTLTMVPEYNMGPDGALKGELGKGAIWTMPVTIDNEEPTVQSMFFSSDAMTNAKQLHVQAKDNQYIAAVQIYNEAGTKQLKTISPNQTVAGADVSMQVDVSDIYEKNVLINVVDYAGNAVAYTLELGAGEEEQDDELSGFFAYLPAQTGWINFDETSTANPTLLVESGTDFGAAEHVKGYVFASDLNGYLYVMEHGKYEPTVICQTGYDAIQDMAYNPANGKLYGLAAVTLQNGTIESNLILEIDLLSGQITQLGQITLDDTKDTLQTLACSDEGVFYAVTSSATESVLYSFTIDDQSKLSAPTKLGGTGYQANYIQSMTYDHSTGELYWAQFFKPGIFSTPESHLLKLDRNTGKATVVGELANETTGLYFVSKNGQSFGGTNKVTGVQLIQSDITLYSGLSQALEGYALPWNLNDRSIVWSSSDPSVASVTKDGVVSAHKAGSAVITAAAKLDPTVKATCAVTVKEIDRTVNGIVYGSDNTASFAKINVDDATYTKLSDPLGEDFISATKLGDTLYAATDSAMFEVDPDHGFSIKKVGATAASFTDMTYSPHLDIALATYGYNLLIVDPEEEGCLHSYWNLSNIFTSINGVAYAGYDSTYDYFYLLSSSGSMYLVGIYLEGGGYTLALLDIISTGFSISGQDRNQSIIYDFETGWIFWARYDGEENVSLIAVNEDTEEVVVRGTFPSGVWPVVGLYATGDEADMDRTGDNLARIPMTSFANAECPMGSLRATTSTPQTVLKH